MSVGKCLGVDNLDAPNMREAAAEWPRWQEAEPTLDVVDDVHDLPRWMRRADPANRDAVLAALVRVAETDGRATLVLGWLLVPGASLLAGRLHRLADVIDEVVAGQLWIQICEHDPTDTTYVAKKILSRVERETMAELGIGDLAKRRDPAWASAVLTDRFDESIPTAAPTDEDVTEELDDILRRALACGALTDADRDLLLDLAHAAHRIGAPLRRGRAGLTAPSVAQMVSEDHGLAARTVRRHAADALDKVSGLGWA